MIVREVIEPLMAYVLDGRGPSDEVLIECDGELRSIESIESRLIRDGDERPRDTVLLMIADGPADVSEVTPTTLRTR